MHDDLKHNPLFPDDKTILQQHLSDVDYDWDQLSEQEQQRLKAEHATLPCRQCGTEFEVWDRQKSRLRHYCSKGCRDVSRRTRHWECVLCGKRYRGDWALLAHIRKVHPECDLHMYVQKWWESKGRDLSKLERYCGKCKGERKLNFKLGGYNKCPCINAEKKIRFLEVKRDATTDPRQKAKMGMQLGGTRAFMMKVRNRSSTPQRSRLLPLMVPQNPILHCTKPELLYELGGWFKYLMHSQSDVYAAYHEMVGSATRCDPASSHYQRLKQKRADSNRALKVILEREEWSSGQVEPDATYLFVWALKGNTVDPDTMGLERYHKKTGISAASIESLNALIKCSAGEPLDHLKTMQDKFVFPLLDRSYLQCWYRCLAVVDRQEKEPLNPMVTMEIHRSLANSFPVRGGVNG